MNILNSNKWFLNGVRQQFEADVEKLFKKAKSVPKFQLVNGLPTVSKEGFIMRVKGGNPVKII